MKLIGSFTSPYVRKVRIVLSEKELDYAFVLEDISSPDSEISMVNPLGKIPCLVLESGDAIFDSAVIVEYLDTLSPKRPLIPGDALERAQIRTLEALADGLLDAAILVRNEETWPKRKESERCKAWIERQMKKIDDSLAALEHALEGKSFLIGEQYTLADIAVGCALGYLDFRFEYLDWRKSHPNLAQAQERWMTKASFKATQPALN